MTKKTILFIGLIICFLVVLVVLAYVGIIEKQKINKKNIAEFALNDNEALKISSANKLPTEKEINWDTITPEYFLSEDIFDTNAKTGLIEFDRQRSEDKSKMFVKRWYDENNVPFISITIIEYKDKIFDSEDDIQIKPGSVSEISENETMTYLKGFIFQDEIINKHKIETKQGQGVEITYHLDWFENRFSFSIKALSAEYQDDIKEIAENIINKYPK